MILYSFLEPGLYGGVEWNFYHWNYGRILGWADGEWEEFDAVYVQIFLRSARLALTNVAITLIICYPAALWVSGLPARWRTLVVFLITLPFFVSLVVRLFAWVLILRPSGFLNSSLLGLGLISEPIDIIFTETAVLIGMAYILLPFMFLPIYASVEKLDRSLLEASADLGASPLQTFFRVTLRLTLPGIAAGCRAGLHPQPRQLHRARYPRRGEGADDRQPGRAAVPLGAQLAVRCGPFGDDHERDVCGDRALSESDRPAGGESMKRSWVRRLLGLHGMLFLVFVYAPIVMVVVLSFNSNPINMMIWSGFTFDWYWSILGYPTQLNEQTLYVESTDQLLAAVKNSLIVAVSTTTISTVLGTMTALALYRYRFRAQRFYQGLLYMPMVMPDIVLGIALLVFFVGVGVSLGVISIIIGHCTFLISYVFVVVSARLAGMDDTLEQASADLGANEWVTFRRITLPLILPGVIGGALLAFIISMDDLVITYFIAGVDSTTLPVFIYGMLRRGVKPEINAIATLMLTLSFIIATLGLYLRRRS